MRKILSFVFILLFNSVLHAQLGDTVRFTLMDQTVATKISTSQLKKINSFPKGDILLNTLFKPVKGNNTVYRFVAHEWGSVCEDCDDVYMTWIVIVEVDSKQLIKQAYYYHLDNPSMPSDAFLYKMAKKGLVFKNGMKLGDFDFHCKGEKTIEFVDLKMDEVICNKLLFW